MDEKTAELRDIFIEATGSDTVTEQQSESRGSLADVDDPEATVDRLASEGIVVRALPNPDAVRASLHAVNTHTEVERLLDALESEWT